MHNQGRGLARGVTSRYVDSPVGSPGVASAWSDLRFAIPAIATGIVAAAIALFGLSLDRYVTATFAALAVSLVAASLAYVRFDYFVLAVLAARPSLDVLAVGEVASGPLDPGAGLGALFIAASALWLGVQLLTGRFVRPQPSGVALLLLVVAAIGSVLVSIDPGTSGQAALRILAGAMAFLVIEQLLAQRPRFAQQLIAAIFVSLAIPAVVGLTQLSGGGDFAGLDGVSRISGTFVHPNPFATYLVTVLLVAVSIATKIPGYWRVASWVVGAIAAGLLVVTYARGAWAAALVGLIIIALRHARALIPAFLAFSVVLIALVPSIVTRITDLTEERYTGDAPPNSLAWRVEYWSEVIELGIENPTNGIGLEMTQRSTEDELQPHNVFLQALAETGLPGFGALLIAILLFARDHLRRARSNETDWDRALSTAAIAVLAAFGLQLFSENLLTQTVAIWFLAAGTSHGARPGVGRRSDDTLEVIDS